MGRDLKLRVAHVAPTYMGPDSVVGGGERYATELAKAMANLTPTRLVSFGDRTRQEQWGNLEVHIYEPLWFLFGFRWNPLSFAFLSSLRDTDVVHCHQFHILSTSFSILHSRWRKKPVFVTDLGGGAWDLSYHLHTEHWVRAFLHVSDYAAENEELSAKENRVVGGGVNPQVFQPRAIEREPRVLFVGRIRAAKGLHLLVEAMPPHVPLHVVGPVLDKEYVSQLRQFAAGKKLLFESDCPDGQLSYHYSRACVTVLPSLPGTELLGLVLLESMACETPVICTRVGGMPEIVQDGLTGFVIPPNDVEALREKIGWLLDHPDQAREMGKEGRRRVLEKFTWDSVARRCLQMYQAHL